MRWIRNARATRACHADGHEHKHDIQSVGRCQDRLRQAAVDTRQGEGGQVHMQDG